jgi:hypothetical protein
MTRTAGNRRLDGVAQAPVAATIKHGLPHRSVYTPAAGFCGTRNVGEEALSDPCRDRNG